MAAPVLLYLLKANVALLLFAAAYFGLLRWLTFFTLNRFYLLFALMFAAVYPALPVPALLPTEAATPVALMVMEASGVGPGALAGPVVSLIDWPAVALAAYAVGAAGLLGRLLMQLLALARLRRRSRPALVLGQPVRVLPDALSPFSFGRGIYLNPDQHPGPELAAVLRHELVHVRQAHTLDVLLAQLALAAAWCNPAAWLLRRALLDNLEFLADQAVLATGLDRRAYQYSLLRLSHAPAGPALVSHFTFPTLKNRVIMMNTPLSPSWQLARYFVAGPLVLAVALGISGAHAQGAGPVVPAAAAGAQGPHFQMDPAVDPATRQLPAGIKAYIAKTYPGSTISGYFAADQAAPKAPYARYYASITARDGEKHRLYFNTEEQVVAGPAPATPAPATTAAQLAPRPPGPGNGSYHYGQLVPVVYLDGQRYSGDINDIGPKNIANISVFKGEKARQQFGVEAADNVIVVTTLAHQNDAEVRAFNERVGAGAEKPAVPTPAPATNVPYLAAPALEYITKHYPGARLLGVAEVPATDGGAPRYQAQLAIGRRPISLLFDERGKFISEVSSAR